MKLLGIFLVALFFQICSVGDIYALTVLKDNFDNINNDIWTVKTNNGIVESSNGSMLLSSPQGYSFPFVHNKDNGIFGANFSLKIKYKFSGPLNYGSGIVLTDNLPNNGTLNDLTPNDAIFQIWPESENKFSIWTTLCEVTYIGTCLPSYKKISSFSPDVYQELEIVTFDNKYELLVNGEKIDAVYSKTRNISYIWIGNPQLTTTSTIKARVFIDYIQIEQPDIRKPVVILPGFGGSWDVDAVLTGQPGNNWSVPTFIKEYDGLKNSLTNAGYEEGKDLFVFGYDWRKNLDNLADDLNNFLSSHQLENKEINLIGHSMGGLVARSYSQKYSNEKAKIVTAGTPHMGIVDAYAMWEGMTVWDAVWWQKALHFIATELNRNPGETRIDSARRNAPSVKDLMPTWSFLSKKGVGISPQQMVWRNDYLLSKNSNLTDIQERILSGFSQIHMSKNILKTTQRTNEDTLLGLWEDGKPIDKNQFEFSAGDGYVTASSSGLLFDRKLRLNGGHGEVISKKENIVEILSSIQVATESAVGSDFEIKKNFLVFKLNSPGRMKVCLAELCDANLGLVFENQKMVIVPGYQDGDYKVEINANGETGKYDLLTGKVEENARWAKSSGELKSPNQIDIYTLKTNANELLASANTAESNLLSFYPDGVNVKKINNLRQDILRKVDMAMITSDYVMFDKEIKKWRTLDDYVENAKRHEFYTLFNFADWDHYTKGIYKGKHVPTSKSYFVEELVGLMTETESGYKNSKKLPWVFVDKKFQLIQLKHFLGHAYRSLF